MELTPAEKVTKAKISLQKTKPFFAYLLLHTKTREEKIGTIAVEPKGTIIYDPKFIKELEQTKVETALCHEILHLAFIHMARLKSRDLDTYNIAVDLVVNNILVNDNFTMPEMGIIPSNNEYELRTIKGKMKVKDIHKKSAEQIYDEIYGKTPKKPNKQKGKGWLNDKHKYDNNAGKEEKDEQEKEWKQKLAEATTQAKQKGILPAGMEEIIDKILKNKINWKQLLYRYITNHIIQDYTYMRPSKKSISTGVYMPSILKENMEMIIAIDTSGSIQQEELTEFLTEMVSIARSFSNLKMSIVQCDAKIQNEIEVSNGNIRKIMKLKIRGRGGTDFQPVIDYIKDKKPNTKLLIYFTDGWGSKIKKTINTHIIWAITKQGTDSYIKGTGTVIKM